MRPRGTAHRLTCTARGLVVMMSLLGCASAGPAHDPVPAAAIGFGGGQCGKPVSQRSGPWFCPTGNAQGEPLPAPRGAAVAARAGRVAADPHGHCTVQGCWSILDDYTASYVGGGPYGFGGTTLGDARIYFKVNARGSRIVVGPIWFRSSRGAARVQLSVEVLYTSKARPGGTSQKPMQSDALTHVGILAAGTLFTWPRPFPYWYDKVQKPTVVVEATWHDPSSAYPGRWYMYGKSILFQRGGNGQYFLPTDAVPKDPAGGGWRR